MFRFQPRGKTHIEVCTNLSCALAGADELVEHACRKLGVKEGETTADGQFTVHRGSSAWRPAAAARAVQVNGEWLENAHRGRPRPRALRRATSTARSTGRRAPGETILLRNVFKEDSTSLETYRAGRRLREPRRSYLSMTPDEIIEQVKKSNLRGRGGAGFPTGIKWGFLPKDNPKPRYLCVNADESEPGTFKDRLIIEQRPAPADRGVHRLAPTRSARKTCYIYIRGEFHEGIRTLEKAVDEAYAAGLRRQEHPRHRRRRRRSCVHGGRGRLRVRRGDGADREPRGQARPAAPQAAVPGRRRPLRLPDDRQQRRDPRLRAADPGARAGVVRGLRHREERRAQALLRQRPREAPRRLRGAAWAASRCAS